MNAIAIPQVDVPSEARVVGIVTVVAALVVFGLLAIGFIRGSGRLARR